MVQQGIKASFRALLITCFWSVLAQAAWANVTPDTTLPNPSVVTSPVDGSFRIEGGTVAGANLFHSFSDFSVPTDGDVFFDIQGAAIDHIISRVTGSSPSTIDGLLRAGGTADVFLINPNGVVFGPNAKLEIGGSLITSTAESVTFADGSTFSATPPSVEPLLTVSTPVGLQVSPGSGPLIVNDEGNNLVRGIDVLSAQDPSTGNTIDGLKTPEGESILLIGGDITLNGGVLFAPSGHVELGSVGEGTVSITAKETGWEVGYTGVSEFQDISMTQGALVDASDPTSAAADQPVPSGSINLQGDSVTLEDGSLLFVQFSGKGSEDLVSINASGTVSFTGPNTTLPGLPSVADEVGVFVENLGNQEGGRVQISASNLDFFGGAGIDSSTFGRGNSPDVDIQVANSLKFNGDRVGTGIQSRTEGVGNAGDVNVQARTIDLEDGGVIVSQTLALITGDAGDIRIDADNITVSGVASLSGVPSVISTASFGDGDAGGITIATGTVTVQAGGTINTGIIDEGASGNLIISATKSITVVGAPGLPEFQQSQIAATATDFDEAIEEQFGLPKSTPTGTTGVIILETPVLTITDAGTISSLHLGTCPQCDGGDIRITAQSILLDTQGSVTTFAASGNGGDIDLDVSDNLTLRRGAEIIANAAGFDPEADGGNITANADVVLALPEEDSDIEASATQGTGGNIQITAEGLIGFKISEGDTPESDINASSELGIDGVVEINDPDVDVTREVLPPAEGPTDPANLIALGCASSEASSFTIIGKGGLPNEPGQTLPSTPSLWHDLRLPADGTIASLPSTPAAKLELTGLALDANDTLIALARNAEGAQVGCRFLQVSQAPDLSEH